jgi:hypothetical protein
VHRFRPYDPFLDDGTQATAGKLHCPGTETRNQPALSRTVTSHTYSVLSSRESVQKLGLLRKYRGRLRLTTAGGSVRGNPGVLWRHTASRLPLGKAGSIDLTAGLLALPFAASSPTDKPPVGHIAELARVALLDR